MEAVPTVIFFKDNKAVDRIDGIDIAALTQKCKKIASVDEIMNDSGANLKDRLKALINKAPIMVFMKGDRNVPRCGFSKQLISILNETG